MKSFFKWLVWLEFKTMLGSIVVWALASVLLSACVAFESLPWPAIGWTALVLWLVTSACGAAAFFVSLFSGRFVRALVQFALGVLGLVAFAIAFFFVHALGMAVTEDVTNGEGGWRSSEITEAIPFAVEYKRTHPFLAEYDKRIVFKSGKKIGIWMDTGGGGPFAVYALGDGKFYLADGLDCDFMRNDYRVNVAVETVEINLDGSWAKIPDGTKCVTGKGSDSLSVKTEAEEERRVTVSGGDLIGTTLESRRFLGFIYPHGEFEASTNDPFAGEDGKRRMGLETEWKPCGLMAGVPFEVEDGKRLNNLSRRIRLRSGKTLEIEHDRIRVEACAIYRIGPDEYNVVSSCEKDEMWQRSYRVNIPNETIDVETDGQWLRLPDGALSVESLGWGGNKDGTKTYHVEVRTDNGTAVSHEASPAGDYKKRRELVGTLTKEGEFKVVQGVK